MLVNGNGNGLDRFCGRCQLRIGSAEPPLKRDGQDVHRGCALYFDVATGKRIADAKRELRWEVQDFRSAQARAE